MTNAASPMLTFDGITLKADRVCDDPDGYDRILVRDPEINQQVVKISWHRDARQLGLTRNGDRCRSFKAVEAMRASGADWLSWSEDAFGILDGEKNSVASAAAG